MPILQLKSVFNGFESIFFIPKYLNQFFHPNFFHPNFFSSLEGKFIKFHNRLIKDFFVTKTLDNLMIIDANFTA